jgi:hypothetical protein
MGPINQRPRSAFILISCPPCALGHLCPVPRAANANSGSGRRRWGLSPPRDPSLVITQGKRTAPCMLQECNRDFPVRRSRRPPGLRQRPRSRRSRSQARQCWCSRLVLSLAERCRPSAISEWSFGCACSRRRLPNGIGSRGCASTVELGTSQQRNARPACPEGRERRPSGGHMEPSQRRQTARPPLPVAVMVQPFLESLLANGPANGMWQPPRVSGGLRQAASALEARVASALLCCMSC